MSEKPTYEELQKQVLELEKAELERKRTEETLRRSQAMLARTERISHVGSWEWEIATDTVTWSEELFRIFQLDPEERVSSWAEHSALYHPEDMTLLRQAVEAAVSDGTSYELEIRAFRKDGETLVCLARGFAEIAFDGRAERLFGSLQDITEHKRSVDELLRSNEKYRELAENLNDVLYAVDADGTITYVSPPVKSVFGYTPDELVGKHFAHIIHPEDLDTVRLAFAEVLQGRLYPREYRIRTKSGEYRWIRTSSRPIHEGEQPIGLKGVITDINDRKLAEEALQESEEKYRRIFENELMAICIFDLETFRFIDVNDAYVTLYGYSRAELLANMTIHDITVEHQASYQASQKARVDGTIYISLRYHKKKSGEVFPVEIVGGPYRFKGRSVMFAMARDISARIKAEEEMSLFKAIIEKSGEAIAISDHRGQLWYINPAHEKLFGYSLAEARQLNYRDYYPPESITVLNEVVTPALAAGKGWEGELEAFDASGRRFALWERADSLLGIDGAFQYGFGLMHDITKQNLAELELIKAKHKAEESEKRFRAFIEQAPVAIALFNHDGTGIYANQKYLDILDLKSPGDFVGRPAHEYFAPQFREESKKRSRSRLQGLPVPAVFESIALHADGSEFPIQVAVGEIQLLDRKVSISFLTDITERKLAEEALKKSEERSRYLTKASFEAIFFSEKGLCLEQNDAAEKIFGYTLEEAIGRPGTDWIAPESKDLVMKNMMGGVTEPYEVIAQRKDESKFPVKILVKTIFYKGREVRVTSLQNITERKQAEKEKVKLLNQLNQSQKMESIGTLAGGIAHDFNNILFPIVGYAEMLLEDIPKDSPQRAGLDEIHTGALRARDLVKQILTFSRQDSHEIKLIKIQPIIKEALKLIRSTIPTSIEIKQYISDDCGIIKADPTQIHQIVMNLATNAYHAMEDAGGVLKVNLKQVELGEQDVLHLDIEPGPCACLTFADTGIGMDKKLTKKIFNPFFTTKELGKGTGMGLSVVHGIVKTAGGSITVYSEPGKGTEFRVYLPVVKNSTEKQETQPIEPIQGGTERILLVDDESTIASMEKQVLERLGYQVVSRTSSIEALEAFRANPDKFDMVITDMAMPNMSGDKLASELVKIRPDIPILLCTGFSEKISEEKAAAMGIKNFLMKPIVMRDLAKKIREVLDNKVG